MKRKNIPLRARVVNEVLTIEVGIATLKHAAEMQESFWQPQTDKYALVVSDPLQFAKDIKHELEVEGEDGSTPLHYLLDAAVSRAADNGSEGLDYDAMEALIEAERIARTE